MIAAAVLAETWGWQRLKVACLLRVACMDMQRLRDADRSRAEAEQRRKLACLELRHA